MKGYTVKFITKTGMRGTASVPTYFKAVNIWSKFANAEIWFGKTKLR